MVYIILAHGFEEIEALAPYDILHRGGVQVYLASAEGEYVQGGHGVTVKCHARVSDIKMSETDMLVFPGGLAGVDSLEKSEKAMDLMLEAYESGKFAAAICAAPTLLANLKITDGKKAVCYPGMEDKMGAADIQDGETAVRDGSVITGKAAAASFDFGFKLLEALSGDDAVRKVKKAICFDN